MIKKWITYAIYGSFISYLFSLIILMICFPLFSFDELLLLIKQHFPNIEEIESLDQKLFTYSHYKRFVGISYCFIPIMILSIAGILVKSKWFLTKINSCIQEIHNAWLLMVNQLKRLSLQDKVWFGFILIGILSFRFYYSFQTIYLSDDETGSYVWFSSQGWFVTLLHYPEPNNHVFYNLCSVLWLKLGIYDALAVKLTSIVSNICLMLISFVYLIRVTNLKTAKVVLLILACSFSANLFATQGRGYMLESLFAIIALYSLQEWLNNAEKGSGKYIFGISCVLGFFTIPTFIFPYLGLMMVSTLSLVLSRNKARLVMFIKWQLTIGIGILLLYFPIFCFSSPQALFANEHVAQQGWDFLKTNYWVITEFINFITGVPEKGLVVLAFFILISLIIWLRKDYSKQEKQLHFFVIGSIIAAIFLVLVTKSYPPHRTFTYLGFYISICFGIIISKVFVRTYEQYMKWGLLILVVGWNVTLHFWHQKEQVHYLASVLTDEHFNDLKTSYKQFYKADVSTIYSANKYCFPCKHFRKDALLHDQKLSWVFEKTKMKEADALILHEKLELENFKLISAIERTYLAPSYIYIKSE